MRQTVALSSAACSCVPCCCNQTRACPSFHAAVTAEGGQGPWRACFRVSKGQVHRGAGRGSLTRLLLLLPLFAVRSPSVQTESLLWRSSTRCVCRAALFTPQILRPSVIVKISYFTVNSMSLVGTSFEWQRSAAPADAPAAVDPKHLGKELAAPHPHVMGCTCSTPARRASACGVPLGCLGCLLRFHGRTRPVSLPPASLRPPAGTVEQVEEVTQGLQRLDHYLMNVTNEQRYLYARTVRHLRTAESTHGRTLGYMLLICGTIVLASFVQVMGVRMMFKNNRRLII